MRNSRPEVDGPDGPQQFLLSLCMQLQPNIELVVLLRTKIVDNIMTHFSFGKYKKSNAEVQSLIHNDKIFTSTFAEELELQTEQGVRNYMEKLANFDRVSLCIELGKVRASKFNLMFIQSRLGSDQKSYALITEMTDKTVMLCSQVFGKSVVFGYNNNDLRSFNQLVNKLDDSVANLDLNLDRHGKELFRRIGENLNLYNSNPNMNQSEIRNSYVS